MKRLSRREKTEDLWIGIDPGKNVDPTAVVVLKRIPIISGETAAQDLTTRGLGECRYKVVVLRRFPLGTAYHTIAEWLFKRLRSMDVYVEDINIVIDASGVGVAVMEIFRKVLKLYIDRITSVVITGGLSSRPVERGVWHVAKENLVGEVRAVLGMKRLEVSLSLPEAVTLRRELENFEVKLTKSATEVYSAREGQHDDLVLATALPLFISAQRNNELALAMSKQAEELARVRREAEEMDRRDREQAERWEAFREGKLYRVTQEHADCDDALAEDRIWGQSSWIPWPNVDAPVMEALPPEFEPMAFPRRFPEPTHTIIDMHAAIEEHRKRLGGP